MTGGGTFLPIGGPKAHVRLRQVVRLDPSLASRISDSRRIIAFRNRLIHGYASVSNEVVWGVLEASLPTLRREVQALLEEPESAS